MIEQQKDTRTERRFSPKQSHSGLTLRKSLDRVAFCFAVAATAYAQTDPWSSAATKLGNTFAGPIAKGFALVAIVVGGLELAFGEGGSRRTVGGIIFGLGMALGAASFLSWISP